MSQEECLNEVSPLIEYKNEMSEEFVLGHFVTGNSYQSDFEKSQLEYEGYPGHSEPRLSKVNGVWKLLEAFENDKGFWKRQWTIKKGKEISNFEEIFSNERS